MSVHYHRALGDLQLAGDRLTAMPLQDQLCHAPLGFGQLTVEDIDESIFQLAVGLLRVCQVIGMSQAQMTSGRTICEMKSFI